MTFINKCTLYIAAVSGLLWVAPYCDASLVVTVSPSSQSAQVGASPSAAILLSDSPSTTNSVAGFQFDIAFDPGILQALSVTEQGFFATNGFFFSPGVINNTTGMITFIADVTSGGQTENPSPSDTLISILFQATAPGTSTVGVRNPVFLDSSFNVIPATTVDGQITVTSAAPVPEPASWLFVSAGLVALAAVIHKRAVCPPVCQPLV